MILILFIFWIILSGRVTLEIAIFGALATALVYIITSRTLGWDIKRELAFYRLTPHIAAYGVLLLVEIIKSNIAVLPYAWGIKKPNGRIVEFDSGLQSETAVAVLANSITMTPGTITISADGGRLTVHCLSPEFADGIESTKFAKRLSKMEKIPGVIKK